MISFVTCQIIGAKDKVMNIHRFYYYLEKYHIQAKNDVESFFEDLTREGLDYRSVNSEIEEYDDSRIEDFGKELDSELSKAESDIIKHIIGIYGYRESTKEIAKIFDIREDQVIEIAKNALKNIDYKKITIWYYGGSQEVREWLFNKTQKLIRSVYNIEIDKKNLQDFVKDKKNEMKKYQKIIKIIERK